MLQRQLFRKQALERLSRPEHLDQLLSVVDAKLWLPLVLLSVLAAITLGWSFFGRLSVNVEGPGVLINPNQIKPIVAVSRGEIRELFIHMDSVVTKGQIIAELNQPELILRVEHAQQRLDQAITQHAQQEAEQVSFANEERELIARQTKLLEESIAQSRDLLLQASVGNDVYEAEQLASLDTAGELIRKLTLQLAEKQSSMEELDRQRLIPRDLQLSAEAEMIESTLRLADIDLQKSSLDLQKLQSKHLQMEQQSQINQLNLELKRLLLRVVEIDQSLSESSAVRQRERLQLQQQLSELQTSLERDRFLHCEFNGRVIEMSSFVGQLLTPSIRLASVALHSSSQAKSPLKAVDASLQCVAYLPLHLGKKIVAGIPVQVTPSTVERARFGSMVGVVTRVSEFPVSQEAAVNTLGSSQILADISQASALLEITIDLRTAGTSSGYQWTTVEGPPIRPTTGTTAMSSFTIEQRAPITYVIPLLRGLISGGDESALAIRPGESG